MNICLITEGFTSTGYGHITRCQSICMAFQSLGYKPLIIINGDENSKSILKNNHNVLYLNWIKELDLLIQKLKCMDIAIVDSYIAERSIYSKIQKEVNFPVYLDDNLRINYPPGIIVNGGIGAEFLPYPRIIGRKYLLGLKFQPMRKAFWDLQIKKSKNDQTKILLTLGGSDLRNITEKILLILVQNFSNFEKHVVIGAGFKNKSKIEQEGDNLTYFYYNLDDISMKKLMLISDIAISAAGQTLYELAITDTPTIAIGIAENQKNNIEGWLEVGFIEFAGWYNSNSLENNLIEKIHKLNLAEYNFKNKNIFNSNSTLNLAKKILKLYNEKNKNYNCHN